MKKEILFSLLSIISLLPLGHLQADQINPEKIYVNTLWWMLAGNGNDANIQSMINPERITPDDQLIMIDWPNFYLSDNGYKVYQNWIVVDLGRNYDLSEIKIWNYCDSEQNRALLARGVKDASIWVAEREDTQFCLCQNAGNGHAPISPSTTRNYDPSLKGADKFYTEFGWKKIWAGEIPEGETASSGDKLDPHMTLPVQNKNIRYVGISIDSNRYNENDQFVGLQYILVKGEPSQGPSQISPLDMSKVVQVDTPLTWNPPSNGKMVSKYNVFMGCADENAMTDVTDLDSDGDVTNCSFTLREPLLDHTAYFWRVEAVLEDNSTLCSPVWSFTTQYPVSEFPAIQPVIAVANTTFSPKTLANLVNDSVLDSMGRLSLPLSLENLYLSRNQDTVQKADLALRGIDQQWIYIDLGKSYNLETVKIWNYLEANNNQADMILRKADMILRSIRNVRIYIGSEQAVCPSPMSPVTRKHPKDNFLDAFCEKDGWEEVFSGDLKRYPASYLLHDGDAFPATDILPLKGKLGRYLAIDVNTIYWNNSMTDHSTWGWFTYAGLGHVQITGEKYNKGSFIILK